MTERKKERGKERKGLEKQPIYRKGKDKGNMNFYARWPFFIFCLLLAFSRTNGQLDRKKESAGIKKERERKKERKKEGRKERKERKKRERKIERRIGCSLSLPCQVGTRNLVFSAQHKTSVKLNAISL